MPNTQKAHWSGSGAAVACLSDGRERSEHCERLQTFCCVLGAAQEPYPQDDASVASCLVSQRKATNKKA